MIKVKLALVTGVLFGGLLLWVYIESLQAQRDYHQQTALVTQRQLLTLELELANNRAALAQREQTQATILSAHEIVLEELNAVYEENSQVSQWANASIPDSVLRKLR